MLKSLRRSQASWREVRLPYQVLLMLAPGTCFVALMARFAFPIAEYLAKHFGLTDGPLRGQPNEYAFLVTCLLSMVALFVTGYFAGCAIDALWLRYARRYPWPSVAQIIMHAQYPKHWLRR